MLPVDSDTRMSRDIRVKSLVMLTEMAKQFVMYCQMVPKLNIKTTPTSNLFFSGYQDKQSVT